MIKVIPPNSFALDEPVARLVNVHSRGIDRDWLFKRASIMTPEIGKIRPEPGHSFIHLISVSAMERFGCNRNADAFNEKTAEFVFPEPKKGGPKSLQLDGGLTKYHDTFRKHAHVFKHHQNDDPKKAIGDIVSAVYNPDMHRGELIIKVANDHPEWVDPLEKLARDEPVGFSMACKVPYDICSMCGNQARSRSEYCDHLKNHMTAITKSGHQVFAINDRPKFFDISKVFKPADRIAWSLRKVAEAALPVGGAELAEKFGVTAPAAVLRSESGLAGPARCKMAVAQKLADIEKRIDAYACGERGGVGDALRACPTEDMGDEDMRVMRGASLDSALRSLSSAQVCLSLRDFLRLVMGSKFDSIAGDIPEAEGMLPDLFGRLLDSGEAEECAMDSAYDPEPTSIPRPVQDLMQKVFSSHSLAPEPARKRVQITIIRAMPSASLRERSKLAAVSSKASALAKEYAKYQLSFVHQAGLDDFGRLLTVLGNRRKV